ncbi:MAG: iron-sulfur cluster assembly scaffold protein [Candidatus Aenigmarchaeota archaeon ex4484_56]|nr:MAG: iron-sulfur cluster assembly scaffold protein [Candidatus Aenigmarchaeota archaeon ex4484_56]
MYSKKVIEHFTNPKNVGEIKDADGIGKVGNIVCGDVMWIYIKIGDGEVIEDIKFKTYGCAAAIATSSILTELVKGKTIKESMKITNKDILNILGELPQNKIHCSLLAVDALKEAIYDYLSKKNLPIPDELIKIHKQIKNIEKK